MVNGQAPISLVPIDEDYDVLWARNPLAKEQLKNIILARQNRELQTKLIAAEAVTATGSEG